MGVTDVTDQGVGWGGAGGRRCPPSMSEFPSGAGVRGVGAMEGDVPLRGERGLQSLWGQRRVPRVLSQPPSSPLPGPDGPRATPEQHLGSQAAASAWLLSGGTGDTSHPGGTQTGCGSGCGGWGGTLGRSCCGMAPVVCPWWDGWGWVPLGAGALGTRASPEWSSLAPEHPWGWPHPVS